MGARLDVMPNDRSTRATIEIRISDAIQSGIAIR